ncbi:hypothetical protein [Methylobacterium sp. PvR107]|uniref:hypothetical protein n=1 Tax=Methylobacterium sp. PvR107 TaxID=2806597 RepID=UPI001AE3CC89|nr:hypothetical protein [Methylobacterium sp. PvR107]MBP1180011.1 hypothetical protein [Methylobacterium sp. PvR107]
MADDYPTLQQQIDEIQGVIVNRQAWIDRRTELQREGKTVPPDTGCTAASLPGLRAAMTSLEFLRDNMDEIRTLL